MFTGLIESVCTVSSSVRRSGGLKLVVTVGTDVKYGESISVNGVCLTVTGGSKGKLAEFEVSGESLSVTTLGTLRSGDQVNIERAMQADSRFGGHFVQGHIDAAGKVKKIEKQGDFWRFVFTAPQDIQGLLIPKGSIAIDGVSLTITDIGKGDFGVAIIPATFENTIFKNYKVGDTVNIETDMICRIVKRQLERMAGSEQGLTVEKLKEIGF
ncbi:MAG: riboflavin synthase [Sedimentisphaerales bacterium]|nr:riboflavin synthase [Sedimentisphaerales bacterium]